MICPIPFESETEYGLRYGTKMGVTDVAKPVEEFANAKPEYERFNVFCEAAGVTPIYEWCSRKQRIVIDYPEDTLTLIAMRENFSGKYTKYDALVWYAELYDIPVVKAYEGSVESMTALIDYTKDLKDFEGFVVRFEDGQMCKVKAEDYLRKHKTKEAIQLEKNVIELLVTEKADDVKSFMDPEDLERFEEFERKFWKGVLLTQVTLSTLYQDAEKRGLTVDQRTFAVEFVQKLEPKYQRFMYQIKNGETTLNVVKSYLSKSCSTQAKVDEARWVFNCNWNGD
jgi:RNA ligase